MTEMSSAVAAMHFRAGHEMAVVLRGANGLVERLEEAGPTAAALEFRVGREQRLPASGAAKRAIAMLVVERTRSWRLGTMFAEDAKLLRRERFPPLVF